MLTAAPEELERRAQALAEATGGASSRPSGASAGARCRCSSCAARPSRWRPDSAGADGLAAALRERPPRRARADRGGAAVARPPHAGRRRARRRGGRGPGRTRVSAALPLTLGTAGHIDHGKTALVERLTGTNTDRLPEERARGISIALGYAQLELPSGRRLSVVDVPGHERFVRTMVAGATGIDLYLMVVAADDGVMPQTREHAEVLRALRVTRGVVAITKTDLAPPERAAEEAGASSGAVIVPCCARTARASTRCGRRSTPWSRPACPPGRPAAASAGPARRPRLHDSRRGHGGDGHAVVGRRAARRPAGAEARRGARAGAVGAGARRARGARRGRPAGRAQPGRRAARGGPCAAAT